MILWLLAIFVTAVACAALYYASSGRAVNALAAGIGGATEAHFRLQLKEMGSDIEAGRLARDEAAVARRELARELVRQQGEAKTRPGPPAERFGALLPLSLVLVAGLAFATYAFLGKPDLPAQPLSGRVQTAAQDIDLLDAVTRIEQQVAATPDDLRGWSVIAPAYMQLGRLADAEHAFRRILELAAPTADARTDLAEVLLLQNGGQIVGEPLELLEQAVAQDPTHVRSRFYLAGEATRVGDYALARDRWTALLALANGDEPWVAVAREGLAAAEAGLNGTAVPPVDEVAISGMVEGLNERLTTSGGSIEEWTQLVRSRLVLKQQAEAQAAYDAAIVAYPDAAQRAEVDALAASAGLTSGAAP